MARKEHWGDRSAGWNSISRQLRNNAKIEQAMLDDYELLSFIRKIREQTGNTALKRECKVLLAVRDDQDWRSATRYEVEFIVPMRDRGVDDDAANVRLLMPGKKRGAA